MRAALQLGEIPQESPRLGLRGLNARGAIRDNDFNANNSAASNSARSGRVLHDCALALRRLAKHNCSSESGALVSVDGFEGRSVESELIFEISEFVAVGHSFSLMFHFRFKAEGGGCERRRSPREVVVGQVVIGGSVAWSITHRVT